MPKMTQNPLALGAGDLIHAVNIVQSAQYLGASGTAISWVPFMQDVRAKIEPVRGVEMLRSGIDTSQTYVTVTMRYVPGITPQMQIQYMSTPSTYANQNFDFGDVGNPSIDCNYEITAANPGAAGNNTLIQVSNEMVINNLSWTGFSPVANVSFQIIVLGASVIVYGATDGEGNCTTTIQELANAINGNGDAQTLLNMTYNQAGIPGTTVVPITSIYSGGVNDPQSGSGFSSSLPVPLFGGQDAIVQSTYIVQTVENVLERNRVLKLLCMGVGNNN